MKLLSDELQFPEGPIALPDGSVLVVEIARETLSRVWPDGKIEIVANIPGGPNGAAFGPDGLIYICNNGGYSWTREGRALRPTGPSSNYQGGSIEVVDIRTGKFERLYDSVGPYRLSAPNDLVFDKFGGFYFTDVGKKYDRHADRGFVYYAKADGSEIREVISHAMSPNGVGLSPDGTVLYVAETDTGRLWSWDVVAPGELRKAAWPSPCGGHLVAGVGGYCRFDSLAVTANGNICVAALESCSIVAISPSGVCRSYSIPDFLVTNLCFGGPDMRTAYVTLSHAGKVIAFDWHESGLCLNYSAQKVLNANC